VIQTDAGYCLDVRCNERLLTQLYTNLVTRLLLLSVPLMSAFQLLYLTSWSF